MTDDQITEIFTYHPPDVEQQVTYEANRETMRVAVLEIADTLPGCREKSLFITKCQEAMMMANAAIAIHGLADIPPGEES